MRSRIWLTPCYSLTLNILVLVVCVLADDLLDPSGPYEIELNNRHRECDPVNLGFSQFSGFRISHQVIYMVPPVHHMKIVKCEDGSTVDAHDGYFPLPSNSDIAWGKKFCMHKRGGADCFAVARRKCWINQKSFVGHAGKWIGVLFKCPGSHREDGQQCTIANAHPLSPLVIDNPRSSWWSISGKHALHHVPLVLTFDPFVHTSLDFDTNYRNWNVTTRVDEQYFEGDNGFGDVDCTEEFGSDAESIDRERTNYSSRARRNRWVETTIRRLLKLAKNHEPTDVENDYGDGIPRREAQINYFPYNVD